MIGFCTWTWADIKSRTARSCSNNFYNLLNRHLKFWSYNRHSHRTISNYVSLFSTSNRILQIPALNWNLHYNRHLRGHSNNLLRLFSDHSVSSRLNLPVQWNMFFYISKHSVLKDKKVHVTLWWTSHPLSVRYYLKGH